ncbi:MAG: hypothetical protein M0Q44_13505 [Methylobacter sp.]|jgi:hypothetical protein|nr:hypothetical protein [Methylobacter sp.]
MKLFKLLIILWVFLYCTACARTNKLLFGEVCDAWTAPEYGETCRIIPKQAYKACAGKKAGDAASYAIPPNFHNHQVETISGICQADYKGNLAVKPDNPQN